ncbi:hypothetical protein N7447_010797 [Penicillium robsamsonii]|uniref:uncharacterized protein n=1 Tax=Penicillium robsamsonii TaxID=1792511 RepID=UPI0025488631|nr:uncharacterized protein N7447_010797 [Penicillium robsamsonii]KAJ5807341.1 hypothetical protein N7447_010797 [Penicillium robsamsonii]
MVDPLSIAGLTIGVIQVIIELSERTAELIHDANSFESKAMKPAPDRGQDSNELQNLVNDENIQTKLLKTLLFSQCTVYGGKTLFEQFDPDIQWQIELLCVEISSIL